MDPATDAVLVERVRSGDATAFAPLFERWYDRAFNVARGVVRRPALAADVTQDAFVAAWQQLDRLDDVNAFGGWLLRITRNGALDALRREGRSAATDDETVAALHDRGLPSPLAATTAVGPAEMAEVREREELLWAAAAALGERDASVLDLHLRHGLTPAELAEDLGVTPGHAHQLVHRLRTRLGDAIGAFLLWNRGAPHCSALAGRTGPTFDSAAVQTIRRHTRSCDTCRDDQRRHTDPAKLFAAVPFALAPLAFRSKAALALEQAGAPMPPELTSSTSRGLRNRRSKHDGGVRDPGNGVDQDPADGVRPRADVSSPEQSPQLATTPPPGGLAPSPRRRRFVTLAAVTSIIVAGSTLTWLATTCSADGSLRSASISITSTTVGPTTTPVPAPDTTTATSTTTTTLTTTTVPEPVVIAEPTAAEPSPPAPPVPQSPVPQSPVLQPPVPAPPPADPVPPVDPEPPAAPIPPSEPEPAADPVPPPDSTDPPPPPPVILRFTLAPGSLRCVLPTLPVTARWLTDNADSAMLEWAGQRATGLPATGTHEVCLEPSTEITVIASNAGGNSVASAIW